MFQPGAAEPGSIGRVSEGQSSTLLFYTDLYLVCIRVQIKKMSELYLIFLAEKACLYQTWTDHVMEDTFSRIETTLRFE